MGSRKSCPYREGTRPSPTNVDVSACPQAETDKGNDSLNSFGV